MRKCRLERHRGKKGDIRIQRRSTNGTNHYFNNDPVNLGSGTIRDFQCLFKEPNAAHDAIVAFQKYCTDNKKTFHLVTQNIDGLHKRF